MAFLGVSGHSLLLWGLVICVLGVFFGFWQSVQIAGLPVHKSMKDISELIYETCKTYLITQGKFLALPALRPRRSEERAEQPVGRHRHAGRGEAWHDEGVDAHSRHGSGEVPQERRARHRVERQAGEDRAEGRDDGPSPGRRRDGRDQQRGQRRKERGGVDAGRREVHGPL